MYNLGLAGATGKVQGMHASLQPARHRHGAVAQP